MDTMIKLIRTVSLIITLVFIYQSAYSETLLTPTIITNIEHLYKGPAKDRMEAWVNLVNTHASDSELDKLKVVNAFFNKFPYRTDLEQYGVPDYWMTPIEFMSKGGGNCKDYAISKYFTLEAIGLAQTKLRLTYVIYLVQNEAHMVLTYYPTPGSVPLVLDSLIPNIVSADKRPDLKPIYSFNGDGLWQAIQRHQGRRIGESSSINMWRDLNARMTRELQGIEKG